MYISSISLHNFRNYVKERLTFPSGPIYIYGENGAGKTNLLDALYCVCQAKSYVATEEAQLLRAGTEAFSLRATIYHPLYDVQEVWMGYEAGKKQLTINGKATLSRRAHALRLPILMIVPQDLQLVQGSSAGRRDFFDALLAQLRPTYLQNLLRYKRCLRTRNEVLRKFYEKKRADKLLLQSYDEQLIPLAQSLAAERQALMVTYKPQFTKIYHMLSPKQEIPNISYQSTVLESHFPEEYTSAQAEDIRLCRTTQGAHRDDYQFMLEDKLLRVFASQGQQKSFLWGLKLTHYHIMCEHKGFPPPLLLDDVLDKMDKRRATQLFGLLKEMNSTHRQAQMFITAPWAPDKYLHMQQMSIFELKNGIVYER